MSADAAEPVRELFVYYRVRRGDAVAAKAAVLAMQCALRAEARGLQTRLLTRCDASTPLATWMETYACAGGDGIGRRLQSLIEERAQVLAGWIEGQRHVEAFDLVADSQNLVPD